MRAPGPSSLGMGGAQTLQFEQQPNVGGLGMGMVGQDHYYGQGLVSRFLPDEISLPPMTTNRPSG